MGVNSIEIFNDAEFLVILDHTQELLVVINRVRIDRFESSLNFANIALSPLSRLLFQLNSINQGDDS